MFMFGDLVVILAARLSSENNNKIRSAYVVSSLTIIQVLDKYVMPVDIKQSYCMIVEIIASRNRDFLPV